MSGDLIGNRTQNTVGAKGDQTVTSCQYVNGTEPVMASFTVTRPGAKGRTYDLRRDGPGNVEQVFSDHIGCPLAVYSGSGTVLWEVEALPFGEVNDVLAGSAAGDPLLRYPGQWALDSDYYTTASELCYNGYQWYRPGLGEVHAK